MKKPSEISQNHAQLLMSQLLDGELDASDAGLLEAYLEEHPEAQDWMESLDLVSNARVGSISPHQRAASISSIQQAINADEAPNSNGRGKLISFPALMRPMAAAAAIAIVGTASWLGLRSDAVVHNEPNVVEFVATDIPDASTYIYPDEETGWTVVWVETDPLDTDSTRG